MQIKETRQHGKLVSGGPDSGASLRHHAESAGPLGRSSPLRTALHSGVAQAGLSQSIRMSPGSLRWIKLATKPQLQQLGRQSWHWGQRYRRFSVQTVCLPAY